jgi:hypothetical protein
MYCCLELVAVANVNLAFGFNLMFAADMEERMELTDPERACVEPKRGFGPLIDPGAFDALFVLKMLDPADEPLVVEEIDSTEARPSPSVGVL